MNDDDRKPQDFSPMKPSQDWEDHAEGGSEASYLQELNGEQLESYIDDIADTVRVGLDQSISILTPWFFNNMPKIYYQTTPRQEKVRHLSAIITGHVFETKQTVELWDRDKSKVTHIGPGGDRRILTEMAKKLGTTALKMGGIYFSRDNLLFLSTFFCSATKPLDLMNPRISEKVKHARRLMLQDFPDDAAAVDFYIEHLDNDLVVYATAARLSITYRMVRHMLHHQGAHTFVDTFANSTQGRVSIGFKNINPAEMMEPVLHLIHRYNFNVGRAFVARFERGYDESITVMHFILTHATGEKIEPDSINMRRLTKAVRTLGWVDHDDYSAFAREPYDFSINAANLLRSMASWCNLFLSKQNPYAYSQYRIRSSFINNIQLTRDVAELFRLRFDPLKVKERLDDGYARAQAQVEKSIDALLEDIDRNIFRECVRFVEHVLKTNYFLSSKTGHAFRLAPEILDPKYYPNAPFGIFFITGKDFRCFHVRWKDIARGGIRVVMPRNNADYDYAFAGLFDEVYGLSQAQQLKNKDIPEGGSKAVLVLRPGGHRDQAVRGAVNALLDLLVEEDESGEASRDTLIQYYQKSEIIYLGPDENITNDLIVWIPQQAARRGYRYARAFMSSKPGEGINHKEYGVTSEGLNVYIDNVVRFLGIDPKNTPFSIKMTGGPDGDVAGNELKILHREYGENVRVITVSDGFGCAYDPAGLAWPELLRLVNEDQSIVSFNKAFLSDAGKAFVLPADTNENIRIRNELSSKVYADIFIPAGGRPYSVNSKNWQLFLNDKGAPSCRAIVEGANIFFTSDARERLQEKGVVIIKDSSANKTGVICSSYEIISSLTLSPEEFLQIKPKYVEQVIEILRAKADQEAKLLLRTHMLNEGQDSLVELSMQISREINQITDVLLDEIAALGDAVFKDPFYQKLIFRHCPPLLVELYSERILERLPDPHKVAILASYIASYVVYREGLGWMKRVPQAHWFKALKIYMEKVEMTEQLIQSVHKAKLKAEDKIVAILQRSAARDLTILELQQQMVLS